MKKHYSFLIEGPISTIKRVFSDQQSVGKFLNYTAAGGLVGATAGGLVGFLYGVKVYESKDKTLMSMDKQINNPNISDYKRRELIDARNMILSMSDEEYRNFVIKKYYQKGTAIGSTVGSFGGAFLGGRR